MMNRRKFLVTVGGPAIAPLVPFLPEIRPVCDCGEHINVLIPGLGGNKVCFFCASAEEVNNFLFTKGLRDTL